MSNISLNTSSLGSGSSTPWSRVARATIPLSTCLGAIDGRVVHGVVCLGTYVYYLAAQPGEPSTARRGGGELAAGQSPLLTIAAHACDPKIPMSHSFQSGDK